MSIHFERRGEGLPLVLLHGIGSGCGSWSGQLENLSRRFTVLAWDAPGYGESADPDPEVMGIRGYAECVEALIAGQGFESVCLLGHSWGGVIAQQLYALSPSRIQALILADTNPGNGAEPPEVRDRQLEERFRMVDQLTPSELARERAPALLSPGVDGKVLEHAVAVMSRLRPAGYRSAALSLAEADQRELLPRIRVPTLLVWGELDAVTPLAEGQAMERAIPGARLEVIEGVGHLCYLERPERFSRIVEGFLEEVEA